TRSRSRFDNESTLIGVQAPQNAICSTTGKVAKVANGSGHGIGDLPGQKLINRAKAAKTANNARYLPDPRLAVLAALAVLRSFGRRTRHGLAEGSINKPEVEIIGVARMPPVPTDTIL